MDEAPEIRILENGKYSFLVGRERYVLSSPLEEEKFHRIVAAVQQAVDSFPSHLPHEERLFLGLMAMSHQVDEFRERLDSLLLETGGEGKAQR